MYVGSKSCPRSLKLRKPSRMLKTFKVPRKWRFIRKSKSYKIENLKWLIHDCLYVYMLFMYMLFVHDVYMNYTWPIHYLYTIYIWFIHDLYMLYMWWLYMFIWFYMHLMRFSNQNKMYIKSIWFLKINVLCRFQMLPQVV